jgi:hypothetical protein
MKVVVIDGVREESWDKMINEHPLGSIFQHSSFKKVIIHTFSHTKPYYIALIDRKGDITAGIPLFLVRSRLTGNRLVSLPFVYYSDPLIRSKEEFDQLFTKVLEIYKREKASYLEIKARNSTALLERVNSLVPVFHHKTHFLNLTRGLDGIWGSLHRTCIQQKIRRAEKSGITIRNAISEEDIVSFYRLVAKTRKRLGLPPQKYDYFKNIWKYLGPLKLTDFLMAEKGGEIIGGLNIFKFSHTIYLGHIGSDARFRNSGIDQFLIWKAISVGIQGSYKLLDIGKTSAFSSGLATYKKRWGAVEQEAPSFYYPCQRGIALYNNEKRKSYKIMSFVWQNIPDRLSRIVGRFVYRHMG